MAKRDSLARASIQDRKTLLAESPGENHSNLNKLLPSLCPHFCAHGRLSEEHQSGGWESEWPLPVERNHIARAAAPDRPSTRYNDDRGNPRLPRQSAP